jgi:hypothetical protein
MLKREKTKTSLFLLPILTYETGETANQVLWDIGLFKNAYLKIDTHDYVSPEHTISLHFDWKSGKHTFDRYEDILISNFKEFECIKTYAPDSTSEMMVFNIPDKYNLIYDCFLQGKYSYLPDTYKQHILKFTSQPKDGKIHRILYKSKLLKEEMEKSLGCKIPDNAELYDPPYLEQETFTNELKVNRNQLKLRI